MSKTKKILTLEQMGEMQSKLAGFYGAHKAAQQSAAEAIEDLDAASDQHFATLDESAMTSFDDE